MFFPSSELFYVSTDNSLVKMALHYFNPNLVLNLCAAVVLPSMITLIADSLSIKIQLDCFLVHPLVHCFRFIH